MTDAYPTRVTGGPQLLARDEPVARRGWAPGAPLSATQIADFDRDGFLFLEDVFDVDELTALQAETDWLLNNPRALEAETVITEPQGREIRSIFRLHAQSTLMHRLAADARLAGIASYLLDDEVYLHQSRLNYKPGFEGREFYWHSDFETWHAEDGMPRMRALSASVLLADNTANNGPLMLIPGSQRSFIPCEGKTPEGHYRQSLRRQEFGVPDRDSIDELARRLGIVAPTGKAGSVLLFDCNTLHGSNSNITPFPRANAFFVFNALSNALQKPFAAREPRPEFIATRDPRALAVCNGLLQEMAA